MKTRILLLLATGMASFCSVAADPAPKNQDEMDRWIRSQVENPVVDAAHVSFLAAVDKVYKAEQRNDAWAKPLETKVKSLIATRPGATISGGGCKASLCRFEIAFAKGEDAWDPQTLGQAITQSVQGTTQQVAELHKHNTAKASGSSRVVNELIYLFNDDPAAGWVGPLKQQMGGST